MCLSASSASAADPISSSGTTSFMYVLLQVPTTHITVRPYFAREVFLASSTLFKFQSQSDAPRVDAHRRHHVVVQAIAAFRIRDTAIAQ